MNRPKYHQFTKLNHNSTKNIESKTQSVLRKIKTILISQEYSRLHPNGSCPRKFYGAAKIHEILATDNADKLPNRPIASNINTST